MRADGETITIDSVYPWGRSLDEYQRMFALSERELYQKILGCADGPSSFNAELTKRGGHVISVDPLYAFSTTDIRERIAATHDVLVAGARENSHRFIWDSIRTPEELGARRMRAMNHFLEDFDRGRDEGRYLQQSLPILNFSGGSFDLALCSHFLFLYSDDFDLDFHFDAVREMCTVATEARVFPLLDMRGEQSAHLSPLLDMLQQSGYDPAIEQVPYEFQRGGNQILRVRKN